MANLRKSFKSYISLVNPVKASPLTSLTETAEERIPFFSARTYNLEDARRGIKTLFTRESNVNAALRAGQPSQDPNMDHYVLSVRVGTDKAQDKYSVNVYDDRIEVHAYGGGARLVFHHNDFQAASNFFAWIKKHNYALPSSRTQANGSSYQRSHTRL